MRVPRKNWLEWAVFGASVVLLVVVSGSLLYLYLRGDDRPAAIEVVAGEPMPSPTGFAVPLDVRNSGDATAAAVQIEAVLTTGATTERSTVLIDFVPFRSRRKAWVGFTADPRAGSLDVRVVGYQEP
jgi:uncharacterized protein (TIGR02588 family)